MESLLQQLKGINIKSPQDSFPDIAKNLMRNYIIKKGQKRFAIVEIEFYLFSKDHPDYITYPRKMDAGRWFFHQSGVDLTFQTQGEPELLTVKDKNGKNVSKLSYKNCSFGGILLRGLYLLEDINEKQDIIKNNFIFGPLKCVDILWDDFYAFRNSGEEYPIIIEATENEKQILQKFPLRYGKRCINVDNKQDKVNEWSERIVVQKDGEDENKTKSYCYELFDTTYKYLYRFFNLLSNEDPKDLTKIQPKEARPEITYTLE